MRSLLSLAGTGHASPLVTQQVAAEASPNPMAWRALPVAAQLYAAGAIAAGAFLLVRFFPREYPHPFLFAALVVLSCLTSIWKVNLLLPASSQSTLSVSYAADLMALLLLGPEQAMLAATAGAWAQCTLNVKRPYPAYRTIFSMAAEVITMVATGWAYLWAGGTPAPQQFVDLPKPIVSAVATYFVVNTGLVAGAIALSTRRPLWTVWHDNFLWSAPNFMVAGGGGALAAVLIASDHYWPAILMLAPVYLTYRTYRIFLRRIEDEQRHSEETHKLHEQALEALLQATNAERALAEEKERLSVTLRSIEDGVITTDLDGIVLMINSAAERLTGWSQQEVAGQRLATVFPMLDRETRKRCDHSIAELTQRADMRGVTRSAVLVARDLTERPIEEITAPLRDDQGHAIGVVVVFRDLTDVLKAQEERARADKLTSLGLLAGGIAHDFNNILMGMLGHVSMAQVRVPPGSSAAAELTEAEAACVQARQLTWQLLTFAKGGIPTKKTVAIPGVLKESANLVVRGANIACGFHIAPDLSPVDADAGQLIQVFTNVLLNAREAMPHGGAIQIRAENIVETRNRYEFGLPVKAGPYVRISITDTGIGIPKENLGSIFDPYFSTKQRGSGLGLASSHSIVKSHGGYVSVESAFGRGTTISVNLPAPAGRQAEDVAESPQVGHKGKGRILVMDDEASVRTLTVNMLEYLGYDAEVVSDGSAVLRQYRNALAKGQPFDAVILDLLVPGRIGGKETMEHLSRIDPSVKAILVSGYAQESMMTELRCAGFKAVLPKPFTLEELSRTLRSIHVGSASAQASASLDAAQERSRVSIDVIAERLGLGGFSVN